MVHEACYVSIVGGVDDLSKFSAHHVGARGCLVLFNALLADRRILMIDFANVLHDKAALGNGLSGCQTPALVLCLSRVHICILMQLKPPVFAGITDWANFSHAVLCHGAVKALLTTVVTLFILSKGVSTAASAVRLKV